MIVPAVLSLLIFIAAAGIGSNASANVVPPLGSPLCAASPGGMFGYSVATVQRGAWTFLAISQPWKEKVSLYRTPYTPTTVTIVNVTNAVTVCSQSGSTFTFTAASTSAASTSTSTSTTSASTTGTTTSTSTSSSSGSSSSSSTSTTTFNPSQCSTQQSTGQEVRISPNASSIVPPTWTWIADLVDPWQNSTGAHWDGTSASSALSLFGWDVTYSPDGSWLAVGAPGRSFTAFSALPRQTDAWHPYHGSVVVYSVNADGSVGTVAPSAPVQLDMSTVPGIGRRFYDRFGTKVRFSNDTDSTKQLLFVASNGAWDGVSQPGMLKANGQVPLYGQDPEWPLGSTTSNTNQGVAVFQFRTTAWQAVQFLQTQSTIPLGTLGVDFAVAGTGNRDNVLAVRDYAPITGATSNATSGLVQIYRQVTNLVGGSLLSSFTLVATIRGDGVGSGSTWLNEDWFGLGLALAYDPAITAQGGAVLHVGAPRAAQRVYRLAGGMRGTWDTWWVDGNRTNPAVSSGSGSSGTAGRSFFGGTLVPVDGPRLVLASDAAGTTGRGAVYLWHRHMPGYAVDGYESVVQDSNAGNATAVAEYDWLTTLVANTTNYALGSSAGYAADQFGKSVASAGGWIVVGAPAGGCVYTYKLPVAYPIPGWINTVVLPNNTITAQPPPTNTQVIPGTVSQDKTVLYAVIGSVGGLVVMLPLAAYAAMRYHKQKIMKMLETRGAGDMGGSTAPLTT